MDHHGKTHFTYEGVKKDTKPNTEITQKYNYPSCNTLSLNPYKKYIPFGDSVISIDLQNVIDSDSLNKTPLITGGENPFLSTA